MSGNSNETLNNTEIGSFKSPEELAQALDTKNKTLAERVRSISKKAIETNSKDLRETLKSELNAKEQEEIREALPDTGVEKVLDKTKSDELTQNAVGDIIGKENAQNLKKVEGFFDKLSTGFDKLGDIFEQKGFMAGLGALFIMIKGLFTGDFSQLDEILNPEKKERIKTDVLKDSEYSLGLKALYIINGKELSKESNNVLLVPEIKNTPFSKLKNETNNKTGIAKRLLGDNSSFSDNEILSGVQMLINSEKSLDNIVGKVDQDWRELPIKDIILLLNKRGGSTLANMKDKVAEIDLDIISPVSNIEKIFGKLHSMIDINIEGGKINFGDLGERKEILKNISETTLINIFTLGGNNSETIKTNDTSVKTEKSIAGEGTDNDKDFIKKLFQFKNEIISPLSQLFPSENGKDIQGFFDTKGFTLKELTELYIITGGNSNFNSLDGISKTLLYIKFWSVLGKDRDLRGTFDMEIFKAIGEESKHIKLPEEAKNFFGNILHGTIEMMTKAAGNTISEIWGIVKGMSFENQLKIGAILAAFIITVYYSGALRSRVALGASITALITSIFAIGKVEFEKAGMTEEKMKNGIMSDLEKMKKVS